ncbi:SH3 domain-containing protein [Fructilactobacillus fructivorans]|uniref:SH3 domain-containing protein n=1 Tax=Fructilactobacillus fructivorans TaxID=1614 RepID=UPI0007049AFD|nr:SH3 domain-containing protein [Fructilactobacillus fructivorans]KRN43270.1 muramidase [Fructilactobacillus fructivorans]
MNKYVKKHNQMAISTGETKRRNKLVKTKKGWMKVAMGSIFASAALLTFNLNSPVNADKANTVTISQSVQASQAQSGNGVSTTQTSGSNQVQNQPEASKSSENTSKTVEQSQVEPASGETNQEVNKTSENVHTPTVQKNDSDQSNTGSETASDSVKNNDTKDTTDKASSNNSQTVAQASQQPVNADQATQTKSTDTNSTEAKATDSQQVATKGSQDQKEANAKQQAEQDSKNNADQPQVSQATKADSTKDSQSAADNQQATKDSKLTDNTNNKNQVADKNDNQQQNADQNQNVNLKADVATPDNKIGPRYYDSSVDNNVNKNVQRPSQYTNFNVSNNTNLVSYTQDFINKVTPGAIAGWKKYGVLPSVSIAQAIIESGWGRSGLAVKGNNLFGIKGSYDGQSIYFPTQEYINGQWVTVQAAFRLYPSWSASIEDHGAFLRDNPRYNNLLGVRDYESVAYDLQYDGYATDPSYAQTLINCVRNYGLDSIDKVAFQDEGNPLPAPDVKSTSGTYTFNQTTNIRTSPSLSAPVVGQYKAGESVIYNGTVDADGYTWLRYKSYSGDDLYVAKVSDAPASNPESNVKSENGTYTFGQTTNIRTAPSTSSQVVGQYDAGEKVVYDGTIKADGYTWLRYRASSGAYRYVAKIGNTSAPKEDTNVNSASGRYTFGQTTNIRTAPSTSSQVVGQYDASESVTYDGTVDADGYTWLRYRASSGSYRYVAKIGNDSSSTSTPNSQPNVTEASGTYTFGQTTNVRTSPNTNSQVVGQYDAGERVVYDGKVIANGYTWLRYRGGSCAYRYVAELGNGSGASTSHSDVTSASGRYTFRNTTNIRTSPNTNSQVVGQYDAGESVVYDGKVIANGYTWLRYRAASGAYRYVAATN